MYQKLDVKKYLKEFVLQNSGNYEEEWSLIQDQKEDDSFRILKIIARTVDSALTFMRRKTFYDTYNQATHLFFIVIDVTEGTLELAAEYLTTQLIIFDEVKPHIIQWEAAQLDERLIFYRQSNNSCFRLLNVCNKKSLTEEEFISQQNFNFSLILEALQNDLGGSFDGNLLNVTLDVKREFDSWRLIDYAAKSNDSVLVRFLMLFPWNITERNKDGRTVLEIAVEYSAPQIISAVLDLPILATSKPKKILSDHKEKIDDNILMIALEKGEADTLKFLIECGVDVNYRIKLATGQNLALIDIAWNKQRYDNMLVLLQADSFYPAECKLNLEYIEPSRESNALKRFTKEVIRFHQAIRRNDADEIQRFIQSNHCLKKVHNLSNKSALKIALEAQKYEVFTLLQSKGFTLAENENLQAFYETLNDRQKHELKIAKLKYFKKYDNAHIIFLLSKSKIHMEQIPENADQVIDIKGLLEQLDETAEVSTIMKVLEYSETIEIVFWFNADSCGNLIKCPPPNIRDYRKGHLLVEVGEPRQVLYRLANELTRLALQNVYKNNLKPYVPTDMQNELLLEDIVNKRNHHLRELDLFIQEVSDLHSVTNWPPEVIARVPLMLLHYGKEIVQVKERAPELFTFYENHVHRDFLNYTADPLRFKYMYKIQCLNGLLGELNGISQSRLWLREESLTILDIFHALTIVIVITNFPALAKSDLYQTSIRKDGVEGIENHCIFATIHHLKKTEQLQEIYDVYHSSVKPALIIDCTCDCDSTFRDLWVAMRNFRETERVVLIIKKLNDCCNEFRATIITKAYKWDDLRTDTQLCLLQKTIDFQGYKITLNELVATKMFLIDLFPLEMLIEKEEVKIGEPLPISYGFHESFYIPRTFISHSVIKDTIITDVLLQIISCRLAYTKLEFQELCEKYPLDNIHWISNDEKGKLIWQKSSGGVDELFKYIDSQNQRLFPPDNLSDLLEKARQQKIMIISDTAGMGKSTILTYLSKEIKKNFPTYWIVVLNFDNYTKEFQTHETRQMDAVEFLVEKLLKLSSSFEKVLFKRLLSIGMVILMFDGFDEISPVYEKLATNLLIQLSDTSVEQLWVTTRPHLQWDLQQRLKQLSYSLEPFSIEKQIDFLVRFWKATLRLPENSDQYRMELYAKALLEKLLESINDDVKIFAGIPLQIRMLAEAFSREFNEFYFSKDFTLPELPAKLDLLTIYERFLHNKYWIYAAEKNKLSNVTVAAKELVDILKGGLNLRKLHQQIALEALFPQQKEALLQTKKIYYLPQEQLNRIGIAQYIGSNKVQFIHRTFAEYYAADFFASQLVTESSNTVLIQNFLLTNLLMQDELQTIRVFLDSLLTKTENLIPNSIFASCGHKIAKLSKAKELKYKGNTILYITVEEKNISIVKFLLNSLKIGNHIEALKYLLLCPGNYNKQNYCQGSVMHQVVSDGNLNMLDILWSWIKEAQLDTVSDIGRLLLVKDENSATLWHEVAKQGHADILEQLYKWTISLLNPNFIRTILLHKDIFRKTLWHYAISNGNFEILQKLRLVAGEIRLELSHLKDILLNADKEGQNVWHYAARDSGSVCMLDKLREWTVELQFGPSDLREIILKDNHQKETVLHLAAISGNVEKLEKVWNLGLQIPLNQEELKHLLLKKNNKGQTVFQGVAKVGHSEILEKIWEWLKELEISKEELIEVFSSLDHNHANVWQMTQTASSNVLDKLWIISQEIQFSEDQLKQMLLNPNKDGENPWYGAVKKGKVEIVETLWKYLKRANFNKMDLQRIMLMKNGYNINSLQLAAKTGNIEVCCTLLKFLEEIFTLQEISDILLTETNQYEVLWHHASIKENVQILNIILRWSNEKLTGDMLNNFFEAKIRYEESMALVSKWQVLSLEEVFIWCKKNLSLDIFKNIIFQKQLLGRYAWNQEWQGEKPKVEEVLRWCKQNLTATEIYEMMKIKDREGRSLIQVMKESHLEVLFELWDFDEDIEIRTDFKLSLLLYERNTFYDGHILHFAMRNRNTKVLTNIWKWGQQLQLSKKDFRILTQIVDSNGNTFIHTVVALNVTESTTNLLEETLNCAKAVLESRDFKELFVVKNDHKQNVLHLMAYSRQSKELLSLLRWCVRNLTQDEFRDLMLDRNQYEGATTLHVLARRDVRGWMDTIEWLKYNIEKSSFDQLFLAENDQQQNSYKIAEVEISKGSTVDDERFRKITYSLMLE
ncbi:hypothetical protein Trydic_g18321 [Trypoxylus dichotomus]